MPAITQNDFLNPLFSLNPILVALIILIFGWGSLFVFAVKTNSLSSFLRHPGFMLGDLLMLPLAGFLITTFYQQIDNPINPIISKVWMYPTLFASLIITAFSAYRTLFIWKTAPIDFFLAPHIIFYFLMAYTLINFFIKGLLQLTSKSTPFSQLLYLSTAVVVSVHLILPIIFGEKSFSVS